MDGAPVAGGDGAALTVLAMDALSKGSEAEAERLFAQVGFDAYLLFLLFFFH